MKQIFEIIIKVDEDKPKGGLDCWFNCETGPIELRDFLYWMMEALFVITQNWGNEEGKK